MNYSTEAVLKVEKTTTVISLIKRSICHIYINYSYQVANHKVIVPTTMDRVKDTISSQCHFFLLLKHQNFANSFDRVAKFTPIFK